MVDLRAVTLVSLASVGMALSSAMSLHAQIPDTSRSRAPRQEIARDTATTRARDTPRLSGSTRQDSARRVDTSAQVATQRDVTPWWVRGVVLLLVTAAMVLLAIGVIFATRRFIEADRGEPFGVETHWGGLGGGLGGWRVSPQVIYLIAALAFAGMLTALAASTLDVLRPEAERTTSERQSTSSTDEGDDQDDTSETR